MKNKYVPIHEIILSSIDIMKITKISYGSSPDFLSKKKELLNNDDEITRESNNSSLQ